MYCEESWKLNTESKKNKNALFIANNVGSKIRKETINSHFKLKKNNVYIAAKFNIIQFKISTDKGLIMIIILL